MTARPPGTAHLVHGAIGAGKTTFAKALAGRLRAVRFTHDEWMVALHGADPPADRFAELAGRVSALIEAQWTQCLALGLDVVLDLNFWSRAQRDETRRRVEALGGRHRLYHLAVSEEEAWARVARRNEEPGAMLIARPTFELLWGRCERLGADEEHEVARLRLLVRSAGRPPRRLAVGARRTAANTRPASYANSPSASPAIEPLARHETAEACSSAGSSRRPRLPEGIDMHLRSRASLPGAARHSNAALPLAGAAAVALLAAGCTPALTRTPLAEAHRSVIYSTQAIANVSQDEVATSIETQDSSFVVAPLPLGVLGAGVAGLLVGLVDEAVNRHRTTEADVAVAPLREALAGHDARATVKAVLEKELGGTGTFEGARLELRREALLDRSKIAAVLAAAGTDAVLVVDLGYRLTPGFGHLVVAAVASLYPTKAAADGELRRLAAAPSIDDRQPCPVLYRGVFFSSMPAPASASAGIGRWLEDDGRSARIAIDGGIAEVARMLVWDVDQPGPSGPRYDFPGEKKMTLPQFGPTLQWMVADAQEGRMWLRAASGELASIGDTYSGVSAAVAAAARPVAEKPRPPVASEPPLPDAAGGLTFQFATPEATMQGGEVRESVYSERTGDVQVWGKKIADGVVTYSGQVGFGKGSHWAGLGVHWNLQARGKPFDARRFTSVTFRLASKTRQLRLRIAGPEEPISRSGCYPVYTVDVSEELTDYTIPFAKFRPEARCGRQAREVAETLPALVSFEAASENISERPVTISVGATTLHR